jgi:prolyl-tRNA synthetase
VPIWKTDEEQTRVLDAAHALKATLVEWHGRGDDRLRVHIDSRTGIRVGEKYFQWELQGVPVRLELGPRDLAANKCVAARRDTREKTPFSLDGLPSSLAALLAQMQDYMFAAARDRREANSVREPITYDRFRELMEGDGGFVYAGWNGDPAVEAKIKEETKATIRVIPDAEFRSPEAPATCMVTGEPATCEALWARAY